MRVCAQCRYTLHPDDFSSNQWRKGNAARCMDCVYTGASFPCQHCGREFASHSNLVHHMQTHQPKTFRCPLCNEQRFGNGANVAQHVESGYCSGCIGKENARSAIYNFMRSNGSTQQFFNQQLLENGSYGSHSVPETPYACPQCFRPFRNISQLMQHQAASHPGPSQLQLRL
mmetsp:Transcript_73423/g.153256  ORF Transcript_73423/g.153256 Transcript_73423/m.153256 type:complete len:172 (-) Transcript_73423:9-524(-)